MKDVPAGGEGRIEVRMDVGVIPEGRTRRDYVHTVTVRSNDPEKPMLRLKVRAVAVRMKTGGPRK
jgi:hypothetical protein